MRVFLDTNVLASSIATRGLCAELLESVIHDHEVLTSEDVLRELERVLADKLRLPAAVIAGFLDLIRTEARLVASAPLRRFTIKDATDVPILASAMDGQADVFVTGDKELLDLRNIEGLAVLSPRDLWIRLAGLEGRRKP